MECSEAISLDAIALNAIEKDSQLARLPLRAKRKASTQALAERLIYLCPHSQCRRQYIEAEACANYLIEYEKVIRAVNFCHRRMCTVCLSIQSAHLIAAYDFHDLPEPHLVTLSARNVYGVELAARVKQYEEVWRRIMSREAQQRKRHGGEMWSGLRKLEITYNDKPGSQWRGTFHPHFHVIINSKKAAYDLKRAWMDCWGSEANERGQDVRQCDEASMSEVTKYATKLAITDDAESEEVIRAIDTMMVCLKGKRVLQPFGALRKTEDEYQEGDYGEELEAWGWRKERGLWLPGAQVSFQNLHLVRQAARGVCGQRVETQPVIPAPMAAQSVLFTSKDWLWTERDGRS